MNGYEFVHEGRSFTPDGAVDAPADAASVEARNRETERTELELLKQGPERVLLYVAGVESTLRETRPGRRECMHGATRGKVTTWLGTVLDADAAFGPTRIFPCFGAWGTSKRCSVRATIYGRRYVGWYYESSGSYCRLRRAKV